MNGSVHNVLACWPTKLFFFFAIKVSYYFLQNSSEDFLKHQMYSNDWYGYQRSVNIHCQLCQAFVVALMERFRTWGRGGDLPCMHVWKHVEYSPTSCSISIYIIYPLHPYASRTNAIVPVRAVWTLLLCSSLWRTHRERLPSHD